jgi:hypothetical protein
VEVIFVINAKNNLKGIIMEGELPQGFHKNPETGRPVTDDDRALNQQIVAEYRRMMSEGHDNSEAVEEIVMTYSIPEDQALRVLGLSEPSTE